MTKTKMPVTKTCRFRGVSLHAATGHWEANLTHKKKRHYLGLHKTARAAALVYDRRARALKGSLARLNFPLELTDAPPAADFGPTLTEHLDHRVVLLAKLTLAGTAGVAELRTLHSLNITIHKQMEEEAFAAFLGTVTSTVPDVTPVGGSAPTLRV